ncbi:MAG: hypothetical protein KDC71_08945 [Acidobacteria bacterium]|nr:hypothetical protein [Acidobacteriota bacterium]
MKKILLFSFLFGAPLLAQFNFGLRVLEPTGSPAVVNGETVTVVVQTYWSNFCLGIGQLYVTNPTWSAGGNSGTMDYLGGSNPCSGGFFDWQATIPLGGESTQIDFSSCIVTEGGETVTCGSTVLLVSSCSTQGCEAPSPFTVSNVTTNSFLLSTSVGCLGGQLQVQAGNFNKTFDLTPGSQAVQVSSLSADTAYTVCQTEKCSSGTSQATCATVRTLSNNEANGYFAPPSFVDESSLSLTSSNRLELFLVDPNSDGWDRFGQEQLGYNLSIVQGCDTLYSTTVMSSDYPVRFEVPFNLPTSAYTVELARTVVGGKRDGMTSNGTVLVGPVPGSGSQTLPTDFASLERWLLHVPKVGGGFKGEVFLENRFPDLPATIYLVGFNANGVRVGNVKLLTLVGSSAAIPIYPDGGREGLFEEELLDQVSHLGLWEPGNKKWVTGFIQYRSASAANPLPALLKEQAFDQGQKVGTVFSVQARSSENYWDGVAILNLRSSQNVQVAAVLRKIAGDTEVGRVNLGTIGPGKKLLSVLTNQFPYQADTYYSLEATQGSFQVVGLRGNLVSTLMVESEVVKKK